jgi:hypothetical protein
LIKCPNCGKEVSDKSSDCIHCGASFGSIKSIDYENNKAAQNSFLSDITFYNNVFSVSDGYITYGVAKYDIKLCRNMRIIQSYFWGNTLHFDYNQEHVRIPLKGVNLNSFNKIFTKMVILSNTTEELRLNCMVCGKINCYQISDNNYNSFYPKCRYCGSENVVTLTAMPSLGFFQQVVYFLVPLYGFLAGIYYKDNSPKKAMDSFKLAGEGALLQVIPLIFLIIHILGIVF